MLLSFSYRFARFLSSKKQTLITDEYFFNLSLYRHTEIENKLDALMEKEDSYADFQSLAYWEGVVSPIKLLQTHSFIDFFQYMYVMAIVVFLAWIKLFKYISFNTTMNGLHDIF